MSTQPRLRYLILHGLIVGEAAPVVVVRGVGVEVARGGHQLLLLQVLLQSEVAPGGNLTPGVESLLVLGLGFGVERRSVRMEDSTRRRLGLLVNYHLLGQHLLP